MAVLRLLTDSLDTDLRACMAEVEGNMIYHSSNLGKAALKLLTVSACNPMKINSFFSHHSCLSSGWRPPTGRNAKARPEAVT